MARDVTMSARCVRNGSLKRVDKVGDIIHGHNGKRFKITKVTLIDREKFETPDEFKARTKAKIPAVKVGYVALEAFELPKGYIDDKP